MIFLTVLNLSWIEFVSAMHLVTKCKNIKPVLPHHVIWQKNLGNNLSQSFAFMTSTCPACRTQCQCMNAIWLVLSWQYMTNNVHSALELKITLPFTITLLSVQWKKVPVSTSKTHKNYPQKASVLPRPTRKGLVAAFEVLEAFFTTPTAFKIVTSSLIFDIQLTLLNYTLDENWGHRLSSASNTSSPQATCLSKAVFPSVLEGSESMHHTWCQSFCALTANSSSNHGSWNI